MKKLNFPKGRVHGFAPNFGLSSPWLFLFKLIKKSVWWYINIYLKSLKISIFPKGLVSRFNRTLHSQQSYVFGFLILTVLAGKWRHNVDRKNGFWLFANVKKNICKALLVEQLLSCEFPPFSYHFIRSLVIFRMSYLRNQMSFSKTFFRFCSSLSTLSKLLTCYSISWKLFFTVSLLTSFSRQKTAKIKIPKTYDCWEYKAVVSCKVSQATQDISI